MLEIEVSKHSRRWSKVFWSTFVEKEGKWASRLSFYRYPVEFSKFFSVMRINGTFRYWLGFEKVKCCIWIQGCWTRWKYGLQFPYILVNVMFFLSPLQISKNWEFIKIECLSTEMYRKSIVPSAGTIPVIWSKLATLIIMLEG